MRRFLINSRVLINVLRLTSPRSKAIVPTRDRCLKLGALRCLRSIISLKDEFYNRHIIQHSLFTPVFEGFRANPVGDNLVSSSVIGMYTNEEPIVHYLPNSPTLVQNIIQKSVNSSEQKTSNHLLNILSINIYPNIQPQVQTIAHHQLQVTP